MKFLLAGLLLTIVCSLKAQDIHFSDYSNAYLFFNPAFTGYIPGKKAHRLTLAGRDQWTSALGGNAYRTAAAAYEGRLCADNRPGEFFSVGARIASDWQGDPTLRRTAGHFSLGYTKTLRGGSGSPAVTISAGAESGLIGYNIDVPDLTFDDQFNAPGVEDEVLFSSSPMFMDVGLGASVYIDRSSRNKRWSNVRHINFGAALKHINRPAIGFLGNTAPGNRSSDSTAVLNMRLNLQGGFTLDLNENSLTLLALHSWQRPHNETVVRAMFNFNSQTGGNLEDKSFSLGGGLRINDGVSGLAADALILTVKWYTEKATLSINGDVNISKFSAATKGIGGIEFSTAFYLGKNQCVQCPQF